MTTLAPPSPAETTGQMTAVWRPVGPDLVLEVQPPDPEPPRSALHITVLDELPRDPACRDIVVLPTGRYLVGAMHPTRPFTRYMHRV